MSFVKGQATWATIIPKLIALACGEEADDSGTTVASGDRWIRVGSTADQSIRLPRAYDIVVPAAEAPMRSGYFTATSNALLWAGGSTPGGYQGAETSTWARVTVPYTTPESYSNGTIILRRWMVNLYCQTANTTPGDYSTSRWTYRITDPEGSNGGGWHLKTPTVLPAPSANGTIVCPNGLSIQVGDPSGTVQRFRSYYRMFTGSDNGGYLGGIDWWPQLHRATEAPIFGTAPDGVSGTDYDVLMAGSANVQLPSQPVNSGYALPGQARASFGMGLGIKTAAALTGNKYTVGFRMTRFIARLFAGTGNNNGIVYLQQGNLGTDKKTNTKVYGVGGFVDGVPFLKPFDVPGSVNESAPLQYWMRVTDKALVICLNADPGYSGTSTQNWIVKLDEYQNQPYQLFNVVHGVVQNNYDATHYVSDRASSAEWCQSHLKEGGRDHQTGWMRWDVGTYGTYTNDYSGTTTSSSGNPANYGIWDTVLTPVSAVDSPVGGAYPRPQVNQLGMSGQNGSVYYESTIPGFESHPNPFTDAWTLYTWGYVSGLVPSNQESKPGYAPRYFGYVNCGAYFLPGFGWASGDVLSDQGAGGYQYFLFSGKNYGTGTPGSSAYGGGTQSGGLAIRMD